MNKKDLVLIISERMNISQFLAEELLEKVISHLKRSLRKKEKIVISNFGTFQIVQMKEKAVINPRTKEKVVVPAYRKVKFLPSSKMLEKINR